MTTVHYARKKPVTIEYILFDGSMESVHAILEWSRRGLSDHSDVPIVWDGLLLFVNTLEGRMLVSPGDIVIRGVKGEFYPCKPDIFEATYDAIPGTEEQR